MIISRTPYRVSFFGGGTDYPAWYRTHGGAVLSTAINKYCYLTCRYLPPFFEHSIRIVYSKVETCHSVREISLPPVRAVLEHLGIEGGVEIHHDGDLPARSGMGTSSAFTVGLLKASYALLGKMTSKERLTRESIYLEQDVLKETVGSQDQAAAAHGGMNQITFGKDGEISVHPITVGPERLSELNDHLLLFFTGISRTASEIAGSYVEDLPRKEKRMMRMRAMVDEGLDVLCEGDLPSFGSLLDEAWHTKKSLGAHVSNDIVDDLYNDAKAAGALGGKLTGAGGGGFLLLFAPPERHAAVRERLRKLIHVPFKFERTGSEIIFYDTEADYSEEARARLMHPAAPFQELSSQHGGTEPR